MSDGFGTSVHPRPVRPALRRKTAAITAALTLGAGLAGTVVLAPAAAQAAPPDRWVVNGPSEIQGTLRLDPTGSLHLAVRDDGAPVLSVDDLGVVTDQGDLSSGLRFVDRTVRPVHDSYSMISGPRQERRYQATETVFSFATATGTRLGVAVRISADGLAYRYLLPGAGEHTVHSETATTTFASDGAAWNQNGYAVNYEAEWGNRTISGNVAGNIGYPALFRTGSTYTLLTESDVDGRYAGSHLTHAAGSLTYGTQLFQGAPVHDTGSLETPWRTAIMGDLATVTGSTLVEDLARPSKEQDTSWIKPGVSSWSWLTDSASPRSEARQRDFVDLSARNGWGYVLLDEGWDASWVPRLTRYANAKGVQTIAWFHSDSLWTQEQRDHWLPLLKEWGVAGIKVDFMDSDSQETHQWYDAILADTARRHLMINFHGAALPHGLQRTWPHIMGYEAVRGAENGTNPARSLTLPFTRGVVGPMDYTPVTFSRGSTLSSKAQELAKSVVYATPVQHVSDKPEAYAAEPIAEDFLQNLPTTWDESRLLSGAPGQQVVEARRHGDRWFVGGMRAGSGGPLDVPLAFLGDSSQEWLVQTVVDAGGDGSTLGTDLTRHHSADTLSIPTANNGGFVVVACPADPGRTTCYEPVRPTAVLDVAATPDSAELEIGDSLTVHAVATVTTGTGQDVSFGPRLPAGWSIQGSPVTRDSLAAGDRLEGTWKLTVGPGAVRGDIPLAVGAGFTSGGRDVFASDGVDVFVAPDAPTRSTYVSDIPTWLESTSGWTANQRDRSIDGNPISIRGTRHAKGIGTHAPGRVTVWLGDQCPVFSATVGIDDEVGKPAEASVAFRVLGDGKEIRSTPVLRGTSAPVDLVVDTSGVRRLTLEATDGGDGKNSDHADWADAKVWCGDDPDAPTPPAEAAPLTGTPYVSDLTWTGESNGYGPVERDQSNGEAARGDGAPLTLAGHSYSKGVGMHASAALTTWLGRGCSRFTADVGIDDEVLTPPGEVGTGSVVFTVYGDGQVLTRTPVLANADGAMPLDVDVSGVRSLTLAASESTNGRNFDHADWGGARLSCSQG
jgi:alpha-glucosidase